jgi:elongation factor P
VIDTGGLREDMNLDYEGRLVKVIEFAHNKQGRGSAQVRLTLRDIRSGSTTQHSVQAGTKFQQARLDRQHVQFLYGDGEQFHFMDTESFEQFALNESTVSEAMKYLKENDVCDLLTYNGEPIDIELPVSVILEVAETDPGLKGDTASGGTKPATMETGVVVSVPLFINIGDKLRIDTRSGDYIERAS